jgi:hypothetical protein
MQLDSRLHHPAPRLFLPLRPPFELVLTGHTTIQYTNLFAKNLDNRTPSRYRARIISKQYCLLIMEIFEESRTLMGNLTMMRRLGVISRPRHREPAR